MSRLVGSFQVRTAIEVVSSVACPECGQTIEIRRETEDFQLDQGADSVKGMREDTNRRVEAAMAKRGWRDAKCGRCNDQPEEGA